jgi:hypothetical protein
MGNSEYICPYVHTSVGDWSRYLSEAPVGMLIDVALILREKR